MFFPRKSKLLDNLTSLVLKIKEATGLFEEITNNFGDLRNKTERLKQIENNADDLVHAIKLDIERAFILPIDKNDAQKLTDTFDNIIDRLEQAANRIYIYKIPETNRVLKAFTELLSLAAEEIAKGMAEFNAGRQNGKIFTFCYQKIHELENKGDHLHRQALEELMNASMTDCSLEKFLLIIKMKEIYQELEDTLDEYENAANLFESIKVKYQ